jgi:hypothetical protein
MQGENTLEGERFIVFLIICTVIGVAFTVFTLVAFYIAHLSEQKENPTFKKQSKNIASGVLSQKKTN